MRTVTAQLTTMIMLSDKLTANDKLSQFTAFFIQFIGSFCSNFINDLYKFTNLVCSIKIVDL